LLLSEERANFADFNSGRYINSLHVHANETSLKILEKRVHGRIQGLLNFWVPLDLDATHQPFSHSVLGKSRLLFSFSVLSGEKGAWLCSACT